VKFQAEHGIFQAEHGIFQAEHGIFQPGLSLQLRDKINKIFIP